MKLAVKIGGSIAIGEKGPNNEYLNELAQTLHSFQFEKLVVGIGGGILARNYLRSISPLVSPWEAERIVIELLRANTRLLAFLLKGTPILDEQSLDGLDPRDCPRVLVIGGIKPGRSTDANTAILAQRIGADMFVKMTDVEGVFTADPDSDPNARLIPKATYEDLLSLSGPTAPGRYGVLDELAIRVLQEARIPAKIIDGRNPRNLLSAISGEPIGTTIEP